jgi:hypothetical protein
VTLQALSGTAPDLAPLFRRFRENRLVAIDVVRIRYRWMPEDREWDEVLTRAEVLRLSASNALDFNFPMEKRGDRIFVDLRSLDSEHPDAILTIDSSFLPDLKRLKLRLKDGRLYAKNFRQVGTRWKVALPLESVSHD